MAVKAECPWVASVADSDGLIGTRVHPLGHPPPEGAFSTLRRLTASGPAGYWIRLYLFSSRQFDRPIIDSCTYSDIIVSGAPRNAYHLRRFFAHYCRPDLSNRIIVAPYPVDQPFLGGPVRTDRADQVVAIGRWDSPQKDAGLLCRTANRYLAAGGKTTFVLIGRHGEQWFGSLASRWRGKIRYLGPQPPEVVAEILSRSR